MESADGKTRTVPGRSYCLEITRGKLLSLWLALLLLFLGVSAGVYGWVLIGEDKSAWDYMEYVKLVIGCLGALFLTVSGIWTAFTAFRDAFWPEKSALARSIRSQLPYPDSAPGVRELFAMVDQDIRENGQWFDKVAVGKEWVLGDEASYLPRVRVFFGRDEIKTHSSGERVNTSRIVELYILDDRRQCQITTLRNPRELAPLLDCISLRAPDALRRPYSEYASWCQKTDMEWENMLREYRVKQGKRELEAFRTKDAGMDQNVTLTFPDGSVTSRVTPERIREAMLQCLKEGEGVFSLSLGRPIEKNGCRFMGMECFAAFYEDMEEPEDQELEELGEAELLLKMTSAGAGEKQQYGRALLTDVRTAERILNAWLLGEVPELGEWEAAPLFAERQQEKRRELPPPHLGLMTPLGVFQSHERFTIEDVEVAAQGLQDGSYQSVDLTLPGGYLWMRIQGGDKSDGRCRIFVTRADPDQLRYFRNLCTHRQAAAWLMEFAQGKFRPDWKQWKDYTRQAQKDFKKR